MEALYARLAATATKLISSKGRAAVLKSITPGVYDPATATATPATLDVPVRLVVSDYAVKEVDDTNIKRGDKRAWVAVCTPAPKVGDKVDLPGSGGLHAVINVVTIQPAMTPVFYDIQLRKG